MCWMWPVPWLSFVFVLGLGLEGVEGEPIPDYSYVARGDGCNNEACYNDRTSGIRQAVDDYLNSTTNAATIAKYGLIQDWDVSLVTDMSSAFDFGYGHPNTFNFTANISAWDVGAVETMRSSTYPPPLSLSDRGLSVWILFVFSFLFWCALMLIFFPLFFPPILIVELVFSGGAVFREAKAFNSDLSAWNVGNVMSMFQSTYIVFPQF